MVNLITRFVNNRDVIYKSDINKMALADHSGILLTEFNYDLIYCLCSGYFCGVTSEGKWLLDWDGDRITAVPVVDIVPLGGKMFSAKIGGSYCLMNEFGSFLTQDKYKYIGKFKNGYAKIKIGNMAGYLTKEGKELFRARVQIIT